MIRIRKLDACALLSIAIAFAAAAPRPAIAEPTPGEALSAGLAEVKRGDFEPALTTLQGLVRRWEGAPARTSDLARAYAYLAIAYVGLSEQENARLEFLRAWKTDPTLSLDPKEFPVSIVEMFETIRRDAERSVSAASARPGATLSPHRSGGGRTALLSVGGVAAGVAIGGVAAPAKIAPTATPVPTATPASLPDISGQWAFGFGGISVAAAAYVITIQQNGETFTGSELEWGAPFGNVTGTISANRRFTMVEHRLATTLACDVDATLQTDNRAIIGTAYCNCCPDFISYPAALMKLQ